MLICFQLKVLVFVGELMINKEIKNTKYFCAKILTFSKKNLEIQKWEKRDIVKIVCSLHRLNISMNGEAKKIQQKLLFQSSLSTVVVCHCSLLRTQFAQKMESYSILCKTTNNALFSNHLGTLYLLLESTRKIL